MLNLKYSVRLIRVMDCAGCGEHKPCQVLTVTGAEGRYLLYLQALCDPCRALLVRQLDCTPSASVAMAVRNCFGS